MDLETLRVIISVVGVAIIAFILRRVQMMDRRIRKLGLRVDAELRALHIIAQAEDDDEPEPKTQRGLHGVPRS